MVGVLRLCMASIFFCVFLLNTAIASDDEAGDYIAPPPMPPNGFYLGLDMGYVSLG